METGIAIGEFVPLIAVILTGLGWLGFFFFCSRRLKLIKDLPELREIADLPEPRNNDGDEAQEMLVEDMTLLKDNLLAFTDSAKDWFWSAAEDILEEKAAAGVRMKFIVSTPNFDEKDATVVMGLAKRHPQNVHIFCVPKRPPIDFRLIDGKYLLASHHGIDGDEDHKRKFLRFSKDGAPQNELDAVNEIAGSYLAEMAPVLVTP